MATMQEVAIRAGVSIATVSFVVNGTKNVSPGTREKVTTAMADLGFRNNVVARALASRRTRILALLFPALEHRLGSTALQFVSSAAARASELGYHLVLWPAGTTADDLTELLSGGLADGVLVMEVKMTDPRIEKLVEMDVPFLSIGRTSDPSALPFVDMDFETTVENGLDYLQGLGHRRIGLVIEDLEGTSMDGYGPHIRVERSFRSGMLRRELTPVVVACGPSARGGREAARMLLEQDPKLTAVMIMKDDSTFGLVSGLTSAGLSVPDDVSILAVASSNESGAATEPVLSTMNAPGHELGGLAVEALVARLDTGSTELPHVLLPCVLNVADSTVVARER
ncbi:MULTISPECIES: LacI family DNA-binding transcriptional regulator [unclassified Frondihabitans]|uniref:LacI family DNA-binding transcriptional regulator n=1 Tax=unclassified Frondihabitans TaxID=2626248 RepID=UPI000AD2A76E|nr:LacI family DNA-binding transcriptional regulator [Frondihabitans sp. Leaf304]